MTISKKNCFFFQTQPKIKKAGPRDVGVNKDYKPPNYKSPEKLEKKKIEKKPEKKLGPRGKFENFFKYFELGSKIVQQFLSNEFNFEKKIL